MQTLKLGLIGVNISKSRAPALHTLLGELHDIDVDYSLWPADESSPSAFDRLLQGMQREGYSGCNVTFPFKQTALLRVDAPDLASERVGSCNTLKLGPEIQSTNTDFSGFVRGFRYRMGEQTAGTALMIGAGGVGRAVAFGLEQVGLEHLFVYDLNAAGAKDLVNALNTKGIKATAITAEELPDVARRVDG